MSSHVSPEAGCCIRFAFLRASSSVCQSWTGTASGVAARSSHKSSTSWSFSDGLRSKMEIVVGFTCHTPAIVRKNAVAQKPPCEENRVIMGQEFPLTLGQCGQDARQEVPMRTPKRLDAQERLIDQPALLPCPHCGDLLGMSNSLVWDQTVHTLDRVLSVARRPGRCPPATCAGSTMRLLSAQAQSIALPGSTSGYEVLGRIGWVRYQSRATSHELPMALASHVRISTSHVRSLYHQVSLPLLACHARQHRAALAQMAKTQGGLIIALEGLAPQGGEPHIG